ncbi:MAG: ParA family protein [Xenococcaceae cyanobacterium]
MSKIIALFNQSGGVGKTTLTMNLGFHLAQKKHRVLLVDLDPQGSLTAFMGLEPNELEKTIYNSILFDEPLPIHHQLHDMDLTPANIDLSGAELELVMADLRDFRLQKALDPVRSQYDFILIDCPPSLGLLSYISLVAATHVLIPIQAEYKALRGTELLFQTIQRVKKGANKKLKIAGFVPTMYNVRTIHSEKSWQAIKELAKLGEVFSPIPRTIVFADASQKQLPLAKYEPKHSVVTLMKQIAKSLINQ